MRGHCPARLLPFEVRRLFHGRARNADARGQDGADDKRDAPPPQFRLAALIELTVTKQTATARSSPDLTGGGGQRRDQATPHGRRALKQIGDDCVVLSSDREPHDAAEREKKPASYSASLRTRWQRGGAEHRQRHERHREQHRSPAPEPIPDMPKENAPERAQQIGDCERPQRRVQRGPARAEKNP